MTDTPEAIQERRRETLDKFLAAESPDKTTEVVGKRFVAVETLQLSEKKKETFAHGYDTIRQACNALSAAMLDGSHPEFILDLDSGERIDLDLHTLVIPQSVKAKVVMFPEADLTSLVAYIGAVVKNEGAQRAFKRMRAAIN